MKCFDNIKKIIISIFIFVLALICIYQIQVHADENKKNTDVSCDIASIKIFCGKNGVCFIDEYDMSIEAEKTVKICVVNGSGIRISFRPEAGYELAKVQYTGKEGCSVLKDEIIITEISGSEELNVEFKANEEDGVKTGDNNNFIFYSALALLMLMIINIGFILHKKQKTED